MKKLLLVLGVVFLVLVVLLAAVGVWGGMQRGRLKPSVEAFVDQFYSTVGGQDYRHIWDTLATREFRDSTDYEDFEKFVTGVQQKLGRVKSRSEQAWKVSQATDGLYYAVQYETIRENGRALEDFTLKRKGDGPWLLVGYNVNSKELFQ